MEPAGEGVIPKLESDSCWPCLRYSYDSRRAGDLLKTLNEQRCELDPTFCDYKLVVEGEGFPVHRCVLAASSSYFRCMFYQQRFIEGSNNQVKLENISRVAMKIILDYIYGEDLCLTLEGVYDVLEAADLLLLSDVKSHCVNFLTMLLESPWAYQEALRIYKYGDIFCIQQLSQEAYHVIKSDFQLVTESRAFFELPLVELEKLLASDAMDENDEVVYFNAAVTWVEYDESSRFQHFNRLMDQIRFSLMNPTSLLTTVRNHRFVLKSGYCQNLIQAAMQYQLLPTMHCQMQSSQCKPRCSADSTLIYLCAGPQQFWCYVPGHNKWYPLAVPDNNYEEINDYINGESDEISLICVGEWVYAQTHGHSDNQVGCHKLKQLKRYHLQENKWIGCCLPNNRNSVTLIECDNQLYACHREIISVYSQTDDHWTTLSKPKLDPYQFVVSENDTLYFINLVEGVSQTLRTNNPKQVEKEQILSPNQFIVSILDVVKLRKYELFLSMRTLAGITRKIFNVRSGQWQGASLHHNLMTLQPKPGKHLPLCLPPDELWETCYDRNQNHIYVLGSNACLEDIPVKSSLDVQNRKLDGVLPFFRVDLKTREWTRLAALPEFLCQWPIHISVHDNHSSMATRAY